MYVDKTTNVAVELVRAGLATVHGFSAESLPYGRALQAAEDEAKREKRNVRPKNETELSRTSR